MNCERFQTVAGDLARNENQSPRLGVVMEVSERADALAHIDECERCGRAWTNQRELNEGLRIVAEQMKSLQAPGHLEEKLRVAFRDRSRTRPFQSPQRWRYWVGAVAAALLIAFGLMAWGAHVSSRPLEANLKNGSAPPPESTQPKQPQVAGTEVPSPDGPAPKNSPPRRNRAVNHLVRQGSGSQPTGGQAQGLAANNETKEITTDFVALGYGNAMDLQDGGQLVRVELPRSALARFGLPMNMNRADERVKADVLVGADGLARAIRFVK